MTDKAILRELLESAKCVVIIRAEELEAHGDTLVLLGEVTQPYEKVAIEYNVAHARGVAARSMSCHCPSTMTARECKSHVPFMTTLIFSNT